MAIKIHHGSGNVLVDVGFDLGTAESLRVRADLMITIEQEIVARGLTQAEAAAFFGTSQRRLNDLTRGKIDRLSIDTLVAMLGHAGISVQFVTPRKRWGTKPSTTGAEPRLQPRTLGSR